MQHKQKAFISIVLDKSGSMNIARQETINSTNEQIQAIKDGLNPNIETFVSLTTFNHNITSNFINVRAEEVLELTNDDYKPDGMTALLSAVDFAIDSLENSPGINDPDTSVLLVIITDGQENASSVNRNDLAERIQALKQTERWTITYMGTSADLSMVQDILKVDPGNMSIMQCSDIQGSVGSTLRKSSISNYMSSRSAGEMNVSSFYDTSSK